ncbi:hypothetical protein K6731_06085 [Escherichia whittamii]|uniref:Uncharacterized protein n=1 Tax=Escherichia whittamii TaxID=2762229 RepID=A0ABR8TAL0_9ESCH|nr:hypothetical protein [Escherichia whittamii]MBD7972744.1 hypothetical protein [Escherichia whittamii]MCA4890363.1 hypothetical protein [Escherichia whittamii]
MILIVLLLISLPAY